jgi:hypothetical protein
MNKYLIMMSLCAISFFARAQKAPGVEPYGKVRQEDLELKTCDFEKDANAMVLFDNANLTTMSGATAQYKLLIERHTRLKIFNEFGKGFGNIRIVYQTNGNYGDEISSLQAQTINLIDGKTEITPVDKKSIFTEKIDKFRSALVFAFPNIKPGSVIEYKFRLVSYFLPTWYFQNYIPTRYSKIELNIPSFLNFKSIPHAKQPFTKSVGEGADAYQVREMTNIHSMPVEPYMNSRDENLQRIEYISINTSASTWPKIGEYLMRGNALGFDLENSITGENDIISQAKGLKSDDERIAYIFNLVKNDMKWNDRYQFFSVEGNSRAWDKKNGNSAEINMILYHLLKKAGIKAYPLLVSTKNNGKINPANATYSLFNNAVVYIPVDSAKNYVLDASDKFNQYNVIPEKILNTFGLSIDTYNLHSLDEYGISKAYNMVFVSNNEPSLRSVSLNAEVKADGGMKGNVEINSYSYHKINELALYNAKGEAKYLDTLRNNDNSLRITSFKRENMEVDTLPLIQKIDFDMSSAGSDGNYIYLNTNLFNLTGKNPFYSQNRFSDVDLGFLDNYSAYSVYKLPAGYKSEALPKTMTVMMPDKSIVFKRTVAEDSGAILIKYVFSTKKILYFNEEYPDLRAFYAKMYELLNEQIVLKKS